MKILIITNTRIGDAILTTGVIEHFLKKYPDAKFTLITGYLASPLFEDFPALEKLIPLQKQKYKKHWITLFKQCYGTKWDLIIDFKYSALPLLLCAKKRIRKKPKKINNEAKIVENSRFSGLMYTQPLMLWISHKHKKTANHLLSSFADRPLITFAPTANWLPKTWPLENFIALTKKIMLIDTLKNAVFIIVGAPHESVYCQPLFDALPEGAFLNLCDDTHLLTKAACIAQSNLFIGNDSGLMHIASACNIPIIALFGPTDTTAYYPQNENAIVIKAPYLRKKTQEIDQTVIRQITVEKVASRILTAIKKII